MTIRLRNQLNRLYKHKPQLVAPIINMVAISAKVVVARIMEALDTGNVVTEDEEAFIINQMLSVIIVINVAIMQMSADQKVIIMLPIVLKKIVITYKMKRIMQY